MSATSQEPTERAKLLISERRYKEAVRACRRALLSQPGQIDIRLLLGEALLALERYDEVRVEMLALARKAPENGAVQRVLGEAYLRDGRPKQATESLRKALALDPNDEVAQELLAEADDEEAPVSSTIERWFANEADATAVETESPGWVEEKTPVPAKPATQPGPEVIGPSVELAPDVITEPDRKARSAAETRVRARARTLQGRPADYGLPAAGAAPTARPARPIPRAAPPPRQAARPPVEARTDELDLEMLEAEELASEELGLLEEESTPAFGASFDDDELMGEPTRTHVPDSGSLPTPAVGPSAGPAFPESAFSESAFSEPAFPAAAEAPAAVTAGRGRETPRWLVPVIAGAAALVFAIVGVVGIGAWMGSREVREIRDAASAAGDSGARAEIQAVVDRIGDDGDDELRALRARLLATLTFEHDEDHAEAITATLTDLGEDAPVDATVARAILALHRGDPERAEQALRGLQARGEQVSEAFRARALAMSALGEPGEAKTAARSAAERRPGAPRHTALYALLSYRAGDIDDAISLLGGVPDGASHPAIRVARARILAESGGDPERAVVEANAVIGELSGSASPRDIAWAHLVRALHARDASDLSRAVEEATAAAEHPSVLDESFRMRLAEVFLRADDAERADQHYRDLPSVAVDARGRAILDAEIGLALGDLERVEAAITAAGSGTTLLRAQLLERRGQRDEARPLYVEAMGSGGPGARTAAIRLAAIELADDHPALAVGLLEGRRGGAADRELVPVLARAYLATDRAGEARTLIASAIERFHETPDLLAAQGAVFLESGDAEAAVAPLRTAATARPERASVQADLGRALYLTGAEGAGAAFDAALAADATNARALIGRARLAFDAGAFDDAQTAVDAAATGGEALEVARLRGQLLVVRGAGAAGVGVVRTSTRTHRRDAILWTALGDLYAQAEKDRDAERAYERALRYSRRDPRILLRRATVQVRRGSLRGAGRSVERAVATATERGTLEDYTALIAVTRGHLAFEASDFDGADQRAQEAIAADPQLASAHALRASIAVEQQREGEVVGHLQRAVAGRAPPAEAMGQLVTRSPAGEETCALARRYLAAAPRGFDAPAVQSVADACP